MARSRLRRRQAVDGPWYDRRQVFLPEILQALQRIYWRACKRAQRAGKPFGTTRAENELWSLMVSLRCAPARESVEHLKGALRSLERIENALDREVDAA